MDFYQQMTVSDIRSEQVAHKIHLHLKRFQAFFEARYGQEYISSCVKRDVLAWRKHLLSEDLAASTINNEYGGSDARALSSQRDAPLASDASSCGRRQKR